MGKSSGGYGALVMGRDRPDVFAHLACHAGDAYFEYCYLFDLPEGRGGARGRTRRGRLARRREAEGRGDEARGRRPPRPERPRDGGALRARRRAAPLGLALPFELPSGRVRDDVWARWLEHDPVRFVPRALDAYRRLASVFVDCGTRDEFNLRWGARMVVEALRAGGIEVVHEEFEDGHMGINYRYDASLRFIAPRLVRG